MHTDAGADREFLDAGMFAVCSTPAACYGSGGSPSELGPPPLPRPRADCLVPHGMGRSPFPQMTDRSIGSLEVKRTRQSRQSTGARRAWRSSLLEEPGPPRHPQPGAAWLARRRRGSAGVRVNVTQASTPAPAIGVHPVHLWLENSSCWRAIVGKNREVPGTGTRAASAHLRMRCSL
jgi:hypothetical protein